MREIKFRGENDSGWHYGFFSLTEAGPIIYDTDVCGVPYVVYPDTVGQFTGLLDSNGKEIYEGDIVRFELPPMVLTNEKTAVGVVVYEYGQFLVIIHAMRFTIFSIINDCTVIGNVHDNSELLEGKKKMREIKFRGRDCWGNWRYGDLMKNSIPTASPVIVEDFYYDDPDDSMFEVNPDTVGQFTGLKDAVGREIYEGDVVRHENYICLVVYNSTRFAAFALRKDGWAFDHYFGEAFEASECQVIGNVHDNPELLNNI